LWGLLEWAVRIRGLPTACTRAMRVRPGVPGAAVFGALGWLVSRTVHQMFGS
jgi:hypothetical protein